MILSFINIRKVLREMLKTSGFALGFQHLPRDLNSGQLIFKYVFSKLFQSKRLLKYDIYVES